jgi:hypothetical protein
MTAQEFVSELREQNREVAESTIAIWESIPVEELDGLTALEARWFQMLSHEEKRMARHVLVDMADRTLQRVLGMFLLQGPAQQMLPEWGTFELYHCKGGNRTLLNASSEGALEALFDPLSDSPEV